MSVLHAPWVIREILEVSDALYGLLPLCCALGPLPPTPLDTRARLHASPWSSLASFSCIVYPFSAKRLPTVRMLILLRRPTRSALQTSAFSTRTPSGFRTLAKAAKISLSSALVVFRYPTLRPRFYAVLWKRLTTDSMVLIFEFGFCTRAGIFLYGTGCIAEPFGGFLVERARSFELSRLDISHRIPTQYHPALATTYKNGFGAKVSVE